MQIYTVRRGDSLYSIASRYNVNAQTIAELNRLTDPSELTVAPLYPLADW